MWLTEDGVVHTVALPEPTSAMSDHFRKSLDMLTVAHRQVVLESLEGMEDELFDGSVGFKASDLAREAEAIPNGYLSEPFSSSGELLSYLRKVEIAWRLDAYLVVEDYLLKLDE